MTGMEIASFAQSTQNDMYNIIHGIVYNPQAIKHLSYILVCGNHVRLRGILATILVTLQKLAFQNVFIDIVAC